MMAAAALAAGVSPSALSPEPAWLNDYATAQARVVAVRKPMAVFVGTGKDGWEKVIREGALDPETKKALATKYVCVYVDTNTAAGRSLASAFQVADRGLIISDRAGTSQAYSLSGDLSGAELAQTLDRYADPDREIQATDTVIRQAPAVQVPVYRPAYGPQYQVVPGYFSGST